MMQDLIAAVVSLLLIDPMRERIAERLSAARVPAAFIEEVKQCASKAVPVIVERAVGDPSWAASRVIELWLGSAEPETVLAEAAPDCTAALEGARRSQTDKGW